MHIQQCNIQYMYEVLSYMSTVDSILITHNCSPSFSLVLLVSEDCEPTAWAGHRSLDLESLLRKVGGPVGVRAGFWIGGGLADMGWGDGGRFIAPGEDGRVLGLCLLEERMCWFVLYTQNKMQGSIQTLYQLKVKDSIIQDV